MADSTSYLAGIDARPRIDQCDTITWKGEYYRVMEEVQLQVMPVDPTRADANTLITIPQHEAARVECDVVEWSMNPQYQCDYDDMGKIFWSVQGCGKTQYFKILRNARIEIDKEQFDWHTKYNTKSSS